MRALRLAAAGEPAISSTSSFAGHSFGQLLDLEKDGLDLRAQNLHGATHPEKMDSVPVRYELIVARRVAEVATGIVFAECTR